MYLEKSSEMRCYYVFLKQGRGKGDTDMIQFHNDLRETCVDLMARYTFASCAPLPKR